MSLINKILNQTNMYRLAIYFLASLLLAALLLSFAGVLPYAPLAILLPAYLGALFFLNDLSVNLVWGVLAHSPLLFFVFVMLIEPQTAPARARKKILYGVFTAGIVILYQSYLDIGYTLELGLLSGNVLAFVLSRSRRVILVFRKKEEIGTDREGYTARLKNSTQVKHIQASLA